MTNGFVGWTEQLASAVCLVPSERFRLLQLMVERGMENGGGVLFPRSQQLSVALSEGEACKLLSPICFGLDCWLASSYTGLVLSATAAVRSRVQSSCHTQLWGNGCNHPAMPRRHCFSSILHKLWLLQYFFLPPLLWWPRPSGRRCDIDIPFMTKHFPDIYSLNFDQLCLH